jgi:hypothetical protein
MPFVDDRISHAVLSNVSFICSHMTEWLRLLRNPYSANSSKIEC